MVRIIHLVGLLLSVLPMAPSALADATADLKQAEGFVKVGKHPEAEQVYQRILQAEAANPETVYQAGKMLPRVYLAMDRLPQTREAVQQLLTKSASHERLPHALHEILDQAKILNKIEQAGQVYQNILTAHPGHPQAVWLKMGIAVANAHLGNDQAVDAALQDIIARHGEDERATEALGQTAWAYRKLEEHDKARTVYQYVVDNWPKRDRTVYSQRGVILCSVARGDDAAAEAGVQKLLMDYADSKYMAEIVRSIAADYYRKGKLQPAVTLHQYVVDKHPQTLEALWCQRDIALCCIDAANGEATEAALQKLVTGFAEHDRLPEALADVGEHYRRKGNLQNARRIHRHVVRQFPGSSEAIQSQRNAILSSIGLNDESQIEGDIHTLLTQFAKDQDIAAVTCYVADRLGDARVDERIKLYQYIIDQHPQHELVIRAKAKLGQVKIYQGNDRTGEEILQGILADYADSPRVPEAVRLIGEGYFERATARQKKPRGDTDRDESMQELESGLSESARQDYSKAVEKWEFVIHELPHNSYDTACAYHLAAGSYRQLGQSEKAIEYFQKVCDSWPTYRFAGHAQLMVALLYRGMVKSGRLTESDVGSKIEDALTSVVRNYPNSPAARAAVVLQRQAIRPEGEQK
jgi:TolA-binding protein